MGHILAAWSSDQNLQLTRQYVFLSSLIKRTQFALFQVFPPSFRSGRTVDKEYVSWKRKRKSAHVDNIDEHISRFIDSWWSR